MSFVWTKPKNTPKRRLVRTAHTGSRPSGLVRPWPSSMGRPDRWMGVRVPKVHLQDLHGVEASDELAGGHPRAHLPPGFHGTRATSSRTHPASLTVSSVTLFCSFFCANHSPRRRVFDPHPTLKPGETRCVLRGLKGHGERECPTGE